MGSWIDDEGKIHRSRGDVPPSPRIVPPTRPYSPISYQRYSECNSLYLGLMCAFLGFYGIHHFYAKKVGWGIAYILTNGLFGVGVLRDLYLIGNGKFIDGEGLPVESSTFAKVWFFVSLTLAVLIIIALIVSQ